MSAVEEARSKILIQATACAGLDVILTYRTSIYVKCSKKFQKYHTDNFFLFDKLDRWAIKEKKGGSGEGGEVGARAV